MKAITTCSVLLIVASALQAQLRELERTLNLNGMHPRSVQAAGPMLIFSLTNEPPDLLELVTPKLRPLKSREATRKGNRVQVLFGKDILGVAEVRGVFQGASAVGNAGAKARLTSVTLFFESDAQAATAAAALGASNLTPQPLKK